MIRRIFRSLVIAIAALILVCLGLVASDRPDRFPAVSANGMDFSKTVAMDYFGLPSVQTFVARDGNRLVYRTYESAFASERIIILVHGSAWHGLQFHLMAKHMAEHGWGTVVVPDMRGHGRDPVRRGDIDFVGQLEEDMADLIKTLQDSRGDQEIVLGGHSSGGGFVVRFAGGAYGEMADAFVLLAPFLKYNAPTTKEDAGGWARPATRRIVGLSILNQFGITALNYLPVISFAMPKAVLEGPLGNTATTVYTYRMNTGFAPRSDYEADLASIDKPLLVMAGDADESFHARRYEAVISPHTQTGEYHVLPGVTHLGVVNDDGVLKILGEWLKNFAAQKSDTTA